MQEFPSAPDARPLEIRALPTRARPSFLHNSELLHNSIQARMGARPRSPIGRGRRLKIASVWVRIPARALPYFTFATSAMTAAPIAVRKPASRKSPEKLPAAATMSAPSSGAIATGTW